MTINRFLPFVALAAFAADCGGILPTDTETDVDTGDEFCTDCALQVLELTAACEADVLSYGIYLGAWADTVTIDMHQTNSDNNWEEPQKVLTAANNNVTNVECRGAGDTDGTEFTSETGHCDLWEASYTAVAAVGDVGATTTLFSCDFWQNNDQAGFVIGGDEVAVKIDVASQTDAGECIMFGHRADTAFAGDNCLCWEGSEAGDCGDN